VLEASLSRAENPRIGVDAHIGLLWLIRLRWGAVACQLVALGVARSLFAMDVRTPLLLSLVGATAITNILLDVLRRAGRASGERWVAAVLMFDSLLLTALLMASGGPTNPFSVIYLVHVTLAAVLLPMRWTWFLVGLSAGGFALLFAVSHGEAHAHDRYGSHLQGMWIAYTLAAVLIAYFVGRLSFALRAREQELTQLREEAMRHQRLASLTTLAAGAAHELNTPLSTVAVVAREIERKCDLPATAESLKEDAKLIRRELERCRAILEQMSAGAGSPLGEPRTEISTSDLTGMLMTQLGPDASRLAIEEHGAPGCVSVTPNALTRALANLIDNAMDASGPDTQVRLRIERGADRVAFVVSDHGTGMSEEVLAHAMEPFFTTKETGRGLGLGLFLVKSFADGVGGSFAIESKLGAGTSATLEIPLRGAER
jgi:two-component system sensor histidine kinase RegB